MLQNLNRSQMFSSKPATADPDNLLHINFKWLPVHCIFDKNLVILNPKISQELVPIFIYAGHVS